MKHLYLCCLILIPLLSCKVEDENECDKTSKPEIVRSFVVSAQIESANGPIQDTFYVDFYKTYCDGTISGEYDALLVTDVQGFGYANLQADYIFENEKDYITITLSGGNSYDINEEEIYYYIDAEQEPDYEPIYVYFPIHLDKK